MEYNIGSCLWILVVLLAIISLVYQGTEEVKTGEAYDAEFWERR